MRKIPTVFRRDPDATRPAWRPVSDRQCGGLRIRWLARLTKGKLGAGRWTVAEVAAIRQQVKQEMERVHPFIG